MSFSGDVKQELSNSNTFSDIEQIKGELYGYLLGGNIITKNTYIKFSTENEYNINRFNKLLTKLQIEYNIDIQGNVYSIKFKKDKIPELNTKIIKDIEKSIVRGVFLSSGSVNNPKNKYHLEIMFSVEDNMTFIYNIINSFYINCKSLKRNKNYYIYIKDSNEISKFLALIGANYAVIQFEEIRVIRDTRNNINRIVNCETANLDKTIKAALKQKDAINYLKKTRKYEKLSDNLKEIAELRLKNPNASIEELANKLNNKITKSGVNHRLNKIIEIAKEYQK